DHRIEYLAVLDLLRDDGRRTDGEDDMVAALGAEVRGERPDRIQHRPHAEHADVGGGSHARKRDQRYRNAGEPAKTPHCVFSSEVPDVRDPLVSRLRSSHTPAASSMRTSQSKGYERLYDSSAVFGFEVPKRAGGDMIGTSNPPH